MQVIDRLAEYLHLPAPVLAALACVTGVLAAGSAIRLVGLRRSVPNIRQDRLASLRTWWELWIVVVVATLARRWGIVTLLAVFSGLGLREYLSLAFSDSQDRQRARWSLIAVPLHYLSMLAATHWYQTLIVPVLWPLAIGGALAWFGVTRGFLRLAAVLAWSTATVVFFPSYAALFYLLPEAQNRIGGGEGWFLYLIVLTEVNDIAQALWGRRIGRHHITPQISPHKTWEGFLAGILTSIVLAVILAPWLTTLVTSPGSGPGAAPRWLAWLPAALSGAVIGCAGFFGDIAMSALKRDAGVKDSSQVLPGQGGILDRIDSLTFTAPVFFYFTILYSSD